MNLVNDELIKKWEQLKLEAYLPTPNDVWTIGWGHTHTAYKGMKIRKIEAQQLFERDTEWVEDTISDLVKVPLTQNQYDALGSLIFNIGRTNFSRSTLLKKLNAKDYQGAAEQFLVWNKQKGKTLNGLVRRRAEEMAYFLSDKPQETASASVDAPFKSLLKSKEALTGAGAAVTGAGALLGGLTPGAQYILSAALSVALLAFGAYILWNRVQARRKGER